MSALWTIHFRHPSHRPGVWAVEAGHAYDSVEAARATADTMFAGTGVTWRVVGVSGVVMGAADDAGAPYTPARTRGGPEGAGARVPVCVGCGRRVKLSAPGGPGHAGHVEADLDISCGALSFRYEEAGS